MCVCVYVRKMYLLRPSKIEKPHKNGKLTLQDPGPYISQRDGEIVNK